jgi:RecA-family ATPase
LKEVPEEVEWLWDRMLPTGTLDVLAAYMKVGKSTLVYDLALCVSRGEPFLGFPTKQGGVLIIALEEKREHAIKRLRDYGVTEDDPIWMVGVPLSPTPSLYKELRTFIEDKGIVLVIIDSLARFAMLKDEDDNSEVTKFMSPLVDVAHETNTVVLLIHHERKSGGEAGRSIRGAGAILANVDVAHTLSKVEGRNSTDRTLEVLGRFQEYAPSKLRLGYEDGRYVSQGLEEDQNLATRKEKVMSVVNGTPLDVNGIAQAAGLSPRVVRPVLKVLCQEEKLQQEGEGKRNNPYKYRCPT